MELDTGLTGKEAPGSMPDQVSPARGPLPSSWVGGGRKKMETLNQFDRALITLGSIKAPILGPGAPFNLGSLNIYLQ